MININAKHYQANALSNANVWNSKADKTIAIEQKYIVKFVADAWKGLWCSSTVWLLSTQTRMNVMATVRVRLSLNFHGQNVM
jgi:hypothetical protein